MVMSSRSSPSTSLTYVAWDCRPCRRSRAAGGDDEVDELLALGGHRQRGDADVGVAGGQDRHLVSWLTGTTTSSTPSLAAHSSASIEAGPEYCGPLPVVFSGSQGNSPIAATRRAPRSLIAATVGWSTRPARRSGGHGGLAASQAGERTTTDKARRNVDRHVGTPPWTAELVRALATCHRLVSSTRKCIQEMQLAPRSSPPAGLEPLSFESLAKDCRPPRRRHRQRRPGTGPANDRGGVATALASVACRCARPELLEAQGILRSATARRGDRGLRPSGARARSAKRGWRWSGWPCTPPPLPCVRIRRGRPCSTG